MARRRPEVRRIGYFGSYARDMWGPGSDVDLLVLVDTSDLPFAVRSRDWDTTALPVPADILIYTMEEWNALPIAGRFARTVAAEVVWVFRREDPGAHRGDRRIGE
jgi:predicted nucleotidyltransferase